MMTFIIIIHVIACTALIIIVLIQRGRGSGLVESLSGVESIFGTKTNAFLTRMTTILSVIFFLTCLSLAILSIRQSRSLMRDIKPGASQTQTSPAQTKEGVPPAKTEEKAPAVQGKAESAKPQSPQEAPRPQ